MITHAGYDNSFHTKHLFETVILTLSICFAGILHHCIILHNYACYTEAILRSIRY